ncbi:hypothetical protein S83_013352 [Arachis hypogaea]
MMFLEENKNVAGLTTKIKFDQNRNVTSLLSHDCNVQRRHKKKKRSNYQAGVAKMLALGEELRNTNLVMFWKKRYRI